MVWEITNELEGWPNLFTDISAWQQVARENYPRFAKTVFEAVQAFGPQRVLFGTDAPYDSRMGEKVYRETIAAVDAMDISDEARQKIYVDNARKLFRLTD